MTKPQDFTIKVPSEDPKKKEKLDLADSSKSLKVTKGGDGEELVRDYTIHILVKDFHCDIVVRGGPAAKRSAGNTSRAIEGLITICLYVQQVTESS